MKKIGLLNSNISYVISKMGHGDNITIADAGLPIPNGVERIDVAVSKNNPDFISTLKAILIELKIEKAIIAEEMKQKNSRVFFELKELLGDIEIICVSHEELKALTTTSKAVVRTGECSPYANIILVSGVIF